MSETKKRSSKAAAAAAATPAGEPSPVAAAYDDNNKPLAPALVSPLGLAVTRDEQWVGPYEYHIIALILLVALVTRYYGLTDPAGVVRVWPPRLVSLSLLPPTPLLSHALPPLPPASRAPRAPRPHSLPAAGV